MYYRVVGRKEVFSPSKKVSHDDVGVKALDEIVYGRARFVEELTEEIKEAMIEEFLDKFPEFYTARLEFEEFTEK